MTKNSETWGGARQGSGRPKQNLHISYETAIALRILTRQRRTVSPDIDEDKIVTELIEAAWAELDQEYQHEK